MDKAHKGQLILLFFFSPVLGLLALLKSKSEKMLTFFGTLFFGLVGSAFVYVKGTDGESHLELAKSYYSDMSFTGFFIRSYEILTLSATEGATDLYLHILSFVSSSLLGIPELIHVFAGFVLGYFFSKSVLLILKNNLNVKKSYVLLGFIILLLLIKSIGALNSIRMWTGMWVLFYGTYGWVLNKEKKYLFVMLFSVFVHFSYSVIIIIVIFSYLMRRRKKILTIFYIISFTASLSFTYFSAYMPNLDLLQNRQKIYVIDSDEKEERFNANRVNSQKELENQNFYKAFGQSIYLNFSIVGLSALLLLFYFKKKADERFVVLMALGLGLYSFANFVGFSPALQGRTKLIASVFLLAASIHFQLTLKAYNLRPSKIKLLNGGLTLFLISAFPMILFQISYILQNVSFFILMFPQVSWYLGDADYSLRNTLGVFLNM